ncbi:Hypothetical protein NTJ_14614 [Nesidiocoris tenuis]|uniref:Uncharacterized protein n=1 Tax=Nesidiocoris tenuis TaxID=355587 RepID=A0ABN7BBT1_9HEMI|nr:Hypothetical protein NTJ_14614 [Nesidiocoris tenuis]
MELMTGDEAEEGASQETMDQAVAAAEGAPPPPQLPPSETSSAAYDDEDDEAADEEAVDEAEAPADVSVGGQHLFPSFSSLFSSGSSSNGFGHSRGFYPEFTAPPRSFNTEPSFHHRALYTSGEDTDRVLGSGNFGVIRGGTYYGGGSASAGLNADESYTRGVNSHGRPYRRPNPPPQFKLGGDFFSGFRDFADITTPPKSAYSNIFVVYANRNSTKNADPLTANRPKNIRELIESDSSDDYADLRDQEEEVPSKSKTKKKLSLYKQKISLKESAKKFRSKAVDPLIALS